MHMAGGGCAAGFGRPEKNVFFTLFLYIQIEINSCLAMKQHTKKESVSHVGSVCVSFESC